MTSCIFHSGSHPAHLFVVGLHCVSTVLLRLRYLSALFTPFAANKGQFELADMADWDSFLDGEV